MSGIEFREIQEERGKVCLGLLRSLPLWFGMESAIEQYVKDVEGMTAFCAFSAGKPIGFLALNPRSEWTVEIHVMAIHPTFHRKGVEKRLVQEAEEFGRKSKFEFLSVKTLSPARENKEYDLTRKFYFSAGFRTVEEFKTLWGESNPCLLLIKSLRAG